MDRMPRDGKDVMTGFMIFVKHHVVELRPNGREVNCQVCEHQVKHRKRLLSECLDTVK